MNDEAPWLGRSEMSAEQATNREYRSRLDPAYSSVVAEGCVDRFCGRPFSRNPYDFVSAAPQHEAWAFGWLEGDYYLKLRGEEETRRWLETA